MNTAPLLMYTIGHSTRSAEEFLAMLKVFKVEVLADIRRLPGSTKFPQFDQDQLRNFLEQNLIHYVYLEKLGGRRKATAAGGHSRWRNKSFENYGHYMQTEEFHEGAKNLAVLAEKKTTAIMCSEAVWWRCHRSMVADYFKAKGWDVQHIMSVGKTTEHPYTSPAKVTGGEVSYTD